MNRPMTNMTNDWERKKMDNVQFEAAQAARNN